MSLTASYTFVGQGNWSLSATSGASTNGGDISVVVPLGSKIEKAILYETVYAAGMPSGSVHLTSSAGSVTLSNLQSLGENGYLEAFKQDVTAFVGTAVGNGGSSPFTFHVDQISNYAVDGFALAVVYSNPAEQTRTIAFTDGYSASSGDGFTLGFAAPLNPAPGFQALMSLGIGFGYQADGYGDQYSKVTVNGRQLTTSAGGQDDGISANGGLITIGGIGDSAVNPDPAASAATNGFRTDDELYDLAQGNSADPAPFLAAGTTTVTVSTLNPSHDDNIFFAGFNITGQVAIGSSQNDAPIAVLDSGIGFTTLKGQAFTTNNVLANDFDPDSGDTLTFAGFESSSIHGTLVYNGDGTFTYTPTASFYGVDAFSYTIRDAAGLTATARVELKVVRTPEPGRPNITSGDNDGDGSMRTVSGDGTKQALATGYLDGTAFTGHQQLFGGDGSDSFTLRAKDFGVAENGIHKYITDFQGAGGWYATNNDFISFTGFGAGSTLSFSHSGSTGPSDPGSIDFYTIHDAATGHDWTLLVHSMNGRHLATGDYNFY
jgi:hypothetical protein